MNTQSALRSNRVLVADGDPTVMNSKSTKILLVEDNPVQTVMIQAMLEKHNHAKSYLNQLELICVAQLSDGLLRLAEGDVDIVLLDLSLPDTDGLETLLKLREYEQDVPVVVLTAHDDDSLAVEAMQSGAQDYLVKGQINKEMLVRSLRYALERHQLTRQLSLIDDLTGLYNRRGFMTLAEQHLKIARRTQRDCLLVYADMDGLKQINDTFGHQEGSKALKHVAEVLRKGFRESDLIARIGGDEYTILMLDAPYEIGVQIATRLQELLAMHNRWCEAPYELALSIGSARYEHGTTGTLEELLGAADIAMYENKRSKRFNDRVSEALEDIKEPLGVAV